MGSLLEKERDLVENRKTGHAKRSYQQQWNRFQKHAGIVFLFYPMCCTYRNREIETGSGWSRRILVSGDSVEVLFLFCFFLFFLGGRHAQRKKKK